MAITINDILTELDEIKPNTYDDDLKVRWISNIEYHVYNDILSTHYYNDGETDPEFQGYTENDMSAEVLAQEPYSELYKFWLMAQIDFYNNEADRYTGSMAMFNAAYQDFADHYNRTHRPIIGTLDL